MKTLLTTVLLLACCMHARDSHAGEVKPDILGIDLAMSVEEARTRLKEIGTFERDERKQQQIWKVRDDHFSHVIIGADKEARLRFITAVARTDAAAQPVAYSSVGDLERARQTGNPAIKNFRFEWDLAPSGSKPATRVLAMGRDDQHLSTLSLKRVEPDSTDN